MTSSRTEVVIIDFQIANLQTTQTGLASVNVGLDKARQQGVPGLITQTDALSASFAKATQAADQFAQANQRASTQVKAHGDASALAAVSTQSFTKLLDTAGVSLQQYSQNFGQAKNAVLDYAKGAITGAEASATLGTALIGLSVTAVVEATNSFVNLSDAVRRLSEETGLSQQYIQAYRLAMASVGEPTDSSARALIIMQRNVQTMSDQLDASVTPTGKFAEALRKLGVDQKAFVDASPDQQMQILGTRFELLATKTDQTALATDIWGARTGAMMIPMLLRYGESMAQATAEIQRHGTSVAATQDEVMKFHAAQASMNDAFDGLGVALGQNVLPLATKFIGEVELIVTAAHDGGNAIASLADKAGGLGRILNTLIDPVGVLLTKLGAPEWAVKAAQGFEGIINPVERVRVMMDQYNFVLEQLTGGHANAATATEKHTAQVAALAAVQQQNAAASAAEIRTVNQEAAVRSVASATIMSQKEAIDLVDQAAKNAAGSGKSAADAQAMLTAAIIESHKPNEQRLADEVALAAASESTKGVVDPLILTQNNLTEAVVKYGPEAAAAKMATVELDTALKAVKGSSGDAAAEFQVITDHIGATGEALQKLIQGFEDLTTKPTEAERQLTLAVAQDDTQIKAWHATLSDSSALIQHVAGLQETIDKETARGASMQSINKLQDELNANIAADTSGQAANVVQRQKEIDSLTLHRDALVAQGQSLAAQRAEIDASAKAADGKSISIDKLRQLEGQLGLAVDPNIQRLNDQATALDHVATAADGASSSLNTLANANANVTPSYPDVTSIPGLGGGGGGIGGIVGGGFGGATATLPDMSGVLGTNVSGRGTLASYSVPFAASGSPMTSVANAAPGSPYIAPPVAAAGSPAYSPAGGGRFSPEATVPPAYVPAGGGALTPETTTKTKYPVPTNGKFTPEQMAQGLKAAGLPDDAIATMVAIFLAENGGKVVTPPGTAGAEAGAAGFAQITKGFDAKLDASGLRTLSTPEALQAQFEAAVRGYNASGGIAGWNAQTGYRNGPWDPYFATGDPNSGPAIGYGEYYAGPGQGTYRQFMQQGQAAALALTAPPSNVQPTAPGGYQPGPVINTSTRFSNIPTIVAQGGAPGSASGTQQYPVTQGQVPVTLGGNPDFASMTPAEAQAWLDANPDAEEYIKSKARIRAAQSAQRDTYQQVPGSGGIGTPGQIPVAAPDNTVTVAQNVDTTQQDAMVKEQTQLYTVQHGVIKESKDSVTANEIANDQRTATSAQTAAQTALTASLAWHQKVIDDETNHVTPALLAADQAGAKSAQTSATEWYNYWHTAETNVESERTTFHDRAVSEANALGTALESSLRQQYQAQETVQLDGLNTQKKNAQDASNELIAGWRTETTNYIQELDARIKVQKDALSEQEKQAIASVDATSAKQIAALQAQIDGPIAAARQKQEQNLREASRQGGPAGDAAKTQLDAMLEQDRVTRIQGEIKAIQATATVKKTGITADYTDKQQAIDASVTLDKQNHTKTLNDRIASQTDIEQAIQVSLDKQLEAVRKNFGAETTTYALQLQAELLLTGNHQNEMIALLNKYEPSYRSSGKSLGQAMVDGVDNSGLPERLTGVLDIINAARNGVGLPPVVAPARVAIAAPGGPAPSGVAAGNGPNSPGGAIQPEAKGSEHAAKGDPLSMIADMMKQGLTLNLMITADGKVLTQVTGKHVAFGQQMAPTVGAGIGGGIG